LKFITLKLFIIISGKKVILHFYHLVSDGLLKMVGKWAIEKNMPFSAYNTGIRSCIRFKPVINAEKFKTNCIYSFSYWLGRTLHHQNNSALCR